MPYHEKTAIPLVGLAHLLIVYVVWSSTYIAIRVAVRPGAGFPPFTMAAMRCLIAFPMLLMWAKVRGLRIRPKRNELKVLVLSGILLWTFGNAFVALAEKHIASSLAAILIASTPIWVVILESVLDRRPPSKWAILALVIGFVGTGLIGFPALEGDLRADYFAVIALLFASICWGGGSLLQQRRPLEMDPMVSAAYQMLFGGLGVAMLALLWREPLPTPTLPAWLGFAFLLVFGSLIAFTSFLKALHLLPTRLVFTYGYVNPVIAAFLGWLLLGEKIAGVSLLGAGLVLLGVAGLFRSRA